MSGQYVWAHILIGRSRLERGDAEQALQHFSAARLYPQNLGEGKHLLTRETHLDYFSGLALSHMGREKEAHDHWTRAAVNDDPITWLSYFRAMSLEALGRESEATTLLKDMRAFAEQRKGQEAKIDYFATSLPAMLLFEEDLQKRQHITATCLRAQALLGLGRKSEARAALDEVQRLDRSHPGARDLTVDTSYE